QRGVLQQLVGAGRIYRNDRPGPPHMLVRLNHKSIGVIPTGRNALNLSTDDHRLDRRPALFPPHPCALPRSISTNGRERTDIKKGSLRAPCQVFVGTRRTLTSRPSSRSAARAASKTSSSSAPPTTRTSMSFGTGPASPSYRAAQEP